MPVEDFDVLTFITITMISIALMIIGEFGYRKRDMIEGA
jgi:ABC-2 type transport system permease protein